MTSLPPWVGDASIILLSLLVQGIPFLLMGALLGGFVSAWTPFSTLIRHWPRNPLASAFAGSAFAFFIPACDCAVVPVVRRLVRKGLPLSAAFSYLLAAPVLNPICMISTFLAFRFGAPWQMLAFREGGSLLLAVAIGMAVSRVPPAWILRSSVLVFDASKPEPTPWMTIAPDSGSARRWAPAFASSLNDFLSVSALFVVGATCSALIQCFFPIGAMPADHAGLEVPIAMAFAFLMSQCSSADAFVVNAFGAFGLAAQMAFLWLGPIYNLRVLFLYRNVFQYRAILFLGLAIIVGVIAMSMLLVTLRIS